MAGAFEEPRFTRAQLLEAQRHHGTDDKIGVFYSMTRQAVYYWRRRLGVPRIKDHHVTRDRTIRAWFRSGRAVRLICKDIAGTLSVSQVYRILRKGH